MPRLLIVHHTPSPTTHTLLEAVRSGAGDDAIEGVEVVTKAALAATAVDALAADAYLLGTPANLGYISGALKHFFDQIYYPCLEDTVGRPFALWIHGDDDAAGAIRAVDKITTGLRWRQARPPLVITGRPTAADVDACWELGASVAAELTL